MATNFEPKECVIFVQSTKIGTHENKGIHNITMYLLFVRCRHWLQEDVALYIL